MRLAKTLLVLTLATGLACAAAQAAPEPKAAAVKAQMKAVVGPASDTLFAVGGEVDPGNGPDAAKVPAARWDEASSVSARLLAAAVALQKPDMAYDTGAWMAQAKQMEAVSAAAVKAARAHDGAGLSQAANDLGDVCTACHTPYKPKG